MTYIFLLLAVISNALMDAIDHGKGARTLGFLWHFIKYGITFPATFVSGFSIAIECKCTSVLNAIEYGVCEYWLFGVALVAIWQIVYRSARIVLKEISIPKWF